jgi:hypothetical protein
MNLAFKCPLAPLLLLLLVHPPLVVFARRSVVLVVFVCRSVVCAVFACRSVYLISQTTMLLFSLFSASATGHHAGPVARGPAAGAEMRQWTARDYARTNLQRVSSLFLSPCTEQALSLPLGLFRATCEALQHHAIFLSSHSRSSLSAYISIFVFSLRSLFSVEGAARPSG